MIDRDLHLGGLPAQRRYAQEVRERGGMGVAPVVCMLPAHLLTPRPGTIRWFRDIDRTHVSVVGGKNANLGELVRALRDQGVRVPDGFALAADAFRRHLAEARIDREIYAQLDRLDVGDVRALAVAGDLIRRKIRAVALPADIEAELVAAYETLSYEYGEPACDVAVRSSATAEDLPEASFAGQQETYLNVRGAAALVDAVKACMASLFTDRAIVYRAERQYSHRAVALSVGIQKMVRSDLACAGVMFTLDTESGFRDVVEINGAWGLGELVVKGEVSPDEIVIHRPTLAAGYRSIIWREAGEKATKLVYAEGGNVATKLVRVAEGERRRLVLGEDEALQLARWAMAIEAHYGAPMDIEWAKDGETGELFVVQARLETVHAQRAAGVLELYRIKTKEAPLLVGKSVGAKVGTGKVRRIEDRSALDRFQTGEVLVAEMTDPDWEPVLARASAVVTNQGGRTCHAAIVSRELGIPCVVGTVNATHVLETGSEITVSCAEGTEGRVYRGRVAFSRETIDAATLPVPTVPVMLNVGNPESAMQLGMLPSAGVGLARLEFIISAQIGIHPMALLHPERLDASLQIQVRARLAGADPREYFVERLATGIAKIAAAFYPRDVIVRFSDFKTNEYANLLGGAPFEPAEANPMIGFRGASRYYDDRYREAFGLECAALRRVRETIGLVNVKAMIPFCRTLGEARAVQVEMAKHGLVRGQRGFELYVMCEIPNNVVLAAEFSELFDGFSIGSNDLTQLTLGVDRDSELLAHLFDEQDPGVKKLIAEVVSVAHEHGRKVGLCGQAPSDHPEFATFLASIGIDSVSVTPDALASVVRALAPGN